MRNVGAGFENDHKLYVPLTFPLSCPAYNGVIGGKRI